ncbi:TonB family protein [bacterium]|nr:MAG: TonB family protein [bacterium]
MTETTPTIPAHKVVKEYRVLYLESGLLAVLILHIIFVNFLPKMDTADISDLKRTDIVLEVNDIPQTRQALSVKGSPVKPVIPIASDITENILAEETDVRYGTEDGLLEIPAMPAPPGGKGKSEYFPAKLMVSKFPEYPAELQKQGVSGVIILQVKIDVTGKVIDHKVKLNTTKSSVLEKLSIETVYKCRYNPASDGKSPLVSWTDHRFEFLDKTVQ